MSATAKGFAEIATMLNVNVGRVTATTIKLGVSGTNETIQVTAESPLLQRENANITSVYDQKMIDRLPSPGGDLTNMVLTSPGVMLSTGAGYGNFTVFGLPATSNMFTMNGADNVDPFLNLVYSGSSNMSLGANEIQEVAVVTNGYTAQYGRLAGANVNYTTKSGTNNFHGNAMWLWNGASMNANDWFNNNGGEPKPFSNSNQWAGSFGGPIKKNKLFFFYDNEGIRYVVPGASGASYVPSQQFQNAILVGLPAAEVPFYRNMFKIYNGANGASVATPYTADVKGGCGDFGGSVGGITFGQGGVPCVNTFRSANHSMTTERLMSVRVDLIATQNDKLAFRYRQDRGTQATSTDPINQLFSANSNQPEDEGQLNYTRIIGQTMVNQFIFSGMYYRQKFGPPDLSGALKLFPTTFTWVDGNMTNMGGQDNRYPSGKNVGQYQFVDDFSWTKTRHTFKFGINIRRNNITSFAASPGTSGLLTFGNMTDFVNGIAGPNSYYTQTFSKNPEAPVALYSTGLYVQDEWNAASNLHLTLGLRVDRNSDPVCQSNCFARFGGSFLDQIHNPNIPYDQTILTNLHTAFPHMEGLAYEPRIGMAWTPMSNRAMVIRAGIGMFSDTYAGFLINNAITNAPNVASFTVYGNGNMTAPGVANNIYSSAAASNAAFQAGFASGSTLPEIQSAVQAAGSTFAAPNFVAFANHTSNPKFLEWSFQIEQGLGSTTSLTLTYVGNHGSDLFSTDRLMNAYVSPARGGPAGYPPAGSFAGLPNAAPDPRFGTVMEVGNGGWSNYNGLTMSLHRKLSKNFTGTLNYTWSHSLDTVSNGGWGAPYSTHNVSDSVRSQIVPYSLGAQYASSDYDFRHIVSANYSWELPFRSSRSGIGQLVSGWLFSGTVFFRTGEPFSAYNSSAATTFLHNATGTVVLADYLNGSIGVCTSPVTSCFRQAAFQTNKYQQLDFGNVGRNSFRGPGFFDTDFSVRKSFKFTDNGLGISVGVNMYNAFNHPNFANPTGSITSGNFGVVTSTVGPPNSPYGNFQGALANGRLVQTDIKVNF